MRPIWLNLFDLFIYLIYSFIWFIHSLIYLFDLWRNLRITRRTGNMGFSSCPWQSDLLANQLDSLEVLFDTRGCPISRYVALVWVPLCKTGWNRAVFALFFLSRLCHASLYQVYQTAESLFLWKNLSLVSQANQLIHTSCIERW